ncbi:amidohydrolase family protein [Parvibaculum sp.]|uniref:metal-dependent hydrolase family protein n=1 Tax=Parvibaculum sp. TaxID=2024848 RepID=UPI001B03ABD6|nr:amidohydrolase family protein [Parvibaculum sp.]MBO6667382.1 amidohydrolase family protein [Parvibaculum sp.]MBO6693093.1 amidohydrolase family protein [Parvibaculum sp.]MBO6713934.1 amidohydrolase family protein [Parvibaculum sp.]
MRLVIRNARRLDVGKMAIIEDGPLVAEAGKIVSIGEDASADVEIDAKGSFMLPGFIDAHVHFRLATLDFAKLQRWSEVEFGIVMAQLAKETLRRGFTTVRDLGGDVEGLMRAIKAGAAEGPRIIRAGRMLTQTGGHGDAESGPRPVPTCACEMRHTAFGIVADGPDAVRKAARHNLRDGSDFLKIHVSGGVASPADPLESVQYTAAEIAAACEEALHRQTYVAAHAYSAESIIMAVENGVHTIEHGNMINAAAAACMARHGAVMVPTLSTYEAMDLLGRKMGFPEANLVKNSKVLEAGLRSLEIARDAGVTLGWGTDLIGESQARQRREFAIRAEVETPEEILRSMYEVNPKLCGLSGEIGTLTPGAVADIVLTKVNPLEDIAALGGDDAIERVIQAGRPID